MKLSGLKFLLLIPMIAGGAFGETVLVLESWRYDDRAVWRERILPASRPPILASVCGSGRPNRRTTMRP